MKLFRFTMNVFKNLCICFIFIIQISSVNAVIESKPKVYDCFLVLNEWELLEIRMNELDTYVDYFVILEAGETFKGKPKDYSFPKNKHLYEKFSSKIIYIQLDDHIKTNCNWTREAFQRNQLLRGLKNCNPNDIVMISDVDEIPPGNLINNAISLIKEGKEAVSFTQKMYKFYLNRADLKEPWLGTILTTYKYLKIYTPEVMRCNRRNYYLYRDEKWGNLVGGWHFTSMGGVHKFSEKVLGFSHTKEEGSVPAESQDIIDQWAISYPLEHIDNTFPEFVHFLCE